ncbi:MAG: alpha/beta fold hydrolase, partial [Gemmataceae bacterium]
MNSVTAFEEHQLKTNHGSLNYAKGPANGPPLILLHGVTRSWQDWVLVLSTLATRWQIYALDFRGHGHSCRTPGQYHVVDYIQDAHALVKECPEPPVVVGHSLGAMVALAVGGEANARGIVLEDPPFETMGTRIKNTSYLDLFRGVKQVVES